MNRAWAQSLGLRQSKKQYPASPLRFREGAMIDMFDRLYEVRMSSFRLIEYTDMEHTGSIVRDRIRSKHYPPKHAAVISDKCRRLYANIPN